MPRFAANLTLLYNEVPFLERFAAAAASGFRGVEIQFPYAYDREALRERLEVTGLTPVLHNLPAGDLAGGERGIAVLPDRVGEFQDGVGQALEYATTLGCPRLNCLAGVAPQGADDAELRHTLVENLKFAAGALKPAGIRLLIEAINTRDFPGFYLRGTQQAVDLIAATGSDNVFVQYDIYHMHIMEGDLAPTLERHLARIAHLQLADSPGRHEPGTGEINYPFLFRHLDTLGYDGWIGCEYRPRATTEAGLDWVRPYLSA